MRRIIFCFLIISLFLPFAYAEDVPPRINYQGYLTSGYTGQVSVKVAIVNKEGDTTCWSNDGTSINGSEPKDAINVNATDGFFNAILGDTDIPNMKALDKTIFSSNNRLYMRVWVNEGKDVFERLSPDQEIVSTPYAIKADTADIDNIKTALSIDFHNIGGTDDDQPDSDEEVPDNISINNITLYAPAGGSKVGIAKTDPVTELDVNGTVTARSFIGDGSKLTGITAPQDTDWTILGNDIYRGPGNVGIGVPPGPGTRLDVAGNVRFQGDENVYGTVRARAFVGDGSQLTNIDCRPKIYSRIASNFIVTDFKDFVPMYDMRIEEYFPAGKIYIHFNSVFSSPIDKIYGQVAIFVDGAMVSNNTVNITSKYPSEVPLSTDRVVTFSSPGKHTIEIRWRTCTDRSFYQIHGGRTLTVIVGQ